MCTTQSIELNCVHRLTREKMGVHDNNEMTNENLCGELFSVPHIHSCIKKANSSDE